MVLAEDQIKFIAGLIISVPLSYYMRKITDIKNKYLYSFILGTALQFFVYGWDIWMPFLVHIAVYGIIKLKGRKCGAFVTGISILALSIYHIYRMIVDYGSWTLDISTILMSMVCKYSLFAYGYQDGGKQKQKLSANQQVYKLVELPSIYEYLVYCQFLPTCVIGTALQFKDFHNYMNSTGSYSNIPQQKIFKTISRAFITSLICGVVYVGHMILFPLWKMQQASFAQQSPLYILYFSFFCVTTIRFKYYFGWKLSQCAVHASAVSYNDQDKQFTRVITCDPMVVETSLHLRQKVAHWNISSQLWLRRCIYERAPFKDKQLSQAFVTTISAFWHGFYGGYYVTFFLWFLQINLAQKVFKFSQNQKHPIVKAYKSLGIVGFIILWLAVNIIFSHNGLYFQILDSTLSFQILKQIYFIPPIILIALIVIFSKISAKPRTPKSTPDAQKKAQIKKQ